MGAALSAVFSFCVLGAVLAWVYFRRFRPALPPIGVFNDGDVALMAAIIVVIPYVYLALPLWTVVLFLGAGFLSALYFTLQPILPSPWAAGPVAALLVGGDIAIALTQGVAGWPFQLANDLVLIVVIVGATNLWAQSGMKARHVALLTAGLTVYDVVATWRLSVMNDLVERLSHIPLLPVLTWGTPGHGLAVGLGDLIIAGVFPLVMRKAFGHKAGALALGVGLLVIGGTLALLATGTVKGTVPAMVGLGPAVLLQYAVWRRLRPERTTRQYLQAEPLARLAS